MRTNREIYPPPELTKHWVLAEVIHELTIGDGVFTPRGVCGSPVRIDDPLVKKKVTAS